MSKQEPIPVFHENFFDWSNRGEFTNGHVFPLQS